MVIGEAAWRSRPGCLSAPQPPRGGQLDRVTSDTQTSAQPHARNPTGAVPSSGWDSAQAGPLIGEAVPGLEAQRAPSAEFLQQSSFSRAPSAELLQPSSFSPPSCPGAAACVPQLFSRRETPVGSTEIPAAHVPRKEGARKRCWEAASPASAPCAVSFAALLFGWHPPGTPGSLLPCRSSTAAGQTLRPCKSGGGCSVLMGNMVTTCPLPYLD